MYNKTTFTVDGKTITKDYQYDTDSLKRLNTIALSISGTTINKTISYDDQNVYDELNNIISNASTRIKTINYDINGLSYDYTYDNLGNITNLVVSENGITLEKYHYEYDDLNQLVREDTDLEGTNNDFTKVYQYNSNGNIIARIERTTVSEETTDTLLNSSVGKVSYVYDSTWNDQLSSYNGTSISYDNIGNPISIGTYITLDWEGRQLVKYVDTSQDLTIEYLYNDKGYRIKKTVKQNNVTTTTNYFLDGNKVLKETKSNGTEIKYFYDVDNTVTGFSYDNNIYLYVRNLQGDITKIVDESGNVVVEYNYDAWGNIVSQTDTDTDLAEINPYRYRGYRYDEETKYYYLNSRYYNPEIGKFINMDGITGQIGNILGHNLYAYTENNPVMYSDPTGYCLQNETLGYFSDPYMGGCGTGGGGFGLDTYTNTDTSVPSMSEDDAEELINGIGSTLIDLYNIVIDDVLFLAAGITTVIGWVMALGVVITGGSAIGLTLAIIGLIIYIWQFYREYIASEQGGFNATNYKYI